MQPITPLMRDALAKAHAEDGLRRVHNPGEPGAPKWPAKAASLAALVKRGYLARSEVVSREGNRVELWQATDAGREALTPPRRVPRDTHSSMVAKGAATTRVLVRGVWQEQSFPEPEKVRSPGPGWRQRGQTLHAAARLDDRKERTTLRKELSMEQRMVEAKRRGKLQHVDISGELHVIGRILERARKGGRSQPTAAVSRLERVEAKLDHRPDLDDLAA